MPIRIHDKRGSATPRGSLASRLANASRRIIPRAAIPRSGPSPEQTVVPSTRSPTATAPIVLDKPPTTVVSPGGDIEQKPPEQVIYPTPSPPGGAVPFEPPSGPSYPEPSAPSYPEPSAPSYPEPSAPLYPEPSGGPWSDEEMEDTAPEMDEMTEAIDYPDPEDESSMFDVGVDEPDFTAACDLTYDRDSATLCADCHVVGPNYVKTFRLTLPIARIRAEVFRSLGNRTGWGIKDIVKSAKKVAKKVGVKRLVAQVKSIVNNPAFQAGMKAAGSVFPPLGISVAAVSKAAAIVDGVKARDPAAIGKVKELAELAKGGDPAAAKALHALSAIYQASEESGESVSGWAYDLWKRKVNQFLGRTKMFGLLSVGPSKRAR